MIVFNKIYCTYKTLNASQSIIYFLPIASFFNNNASSYEFSSSSSGQAGENFPLSTSRAHKDIIVCGTRDGSIPYSLHPPTPSATPTTPGL